MRIAFCSYTFPPAIGGTETAGRLLAESFRKAGHEVTVLTEIPGPAGAGVLRQPKLAQIIRVCRSSDIIFQNNISLRYAWASIVTGRPCVITTHYYVEGPSWKRRLKRWMILRADRNISASPEFLEFLPPNAILIPPPFDSAVFYPRKQNASLTQLVFVGRLVAAKGVDDLLKALATARVLENEIRLVIIGDGPERAALEKLALELNIASQVVFTGMLHPEAIATHFQCAKALVVPSRIEPFGIVALEGIASGLYVTGSNVGGLPRAIGSCGSTFPPGEVGALADLLIKLWKEVPTISPEQRENHLREFTPDVIAARYLKIFNEVIRK